MQSGDVRRIAGFIDMEKLFCFAVCICLSRTKTFQSVILKNFNEGGPLFIAMNGHSSVQY